MVGLAVADLCATGLVGDADAGRAPFALFGPQVESSRTALLVQSLHHPCGPPSEVGPVLALIAPPARFGQCQCARVEHVFQLVLRGHVFRPQVALQPQQAAAQAVGQALGGREAVYSGEGQVAPNGFGLAGRGILIAVKITESAGRHHHLITQPCGLTGRGGIAPHHDGRAFGQPRRCHLVPRQHVSPVLFQEAGHALHEVVLQLVHTVQPQLPHPLAAARAVSPRGLASLIAAQMDIGRRKHLHHFDQHLLQELECRFAARTEVSLLVGLVRTRKLGVGREHLFRMGRHFDFGHDRDAALCGIFHQFAQLLLGVESAVCARSPGRSIVAGCVVPPGLPERVGAPGPYFGEPRKPLDFHAPARCVGQVEVQAVQLDRSHQVNLPLEAVGVEEVARHVDHQPAPTVGREVGYAAAFQPLAQHQLPQRLSGTQESRFSCGGNAHRVARHMEPVGFGPAAPFRATLAAHQPCGLCRASPFQQVRHRTHVHARQVLKPVGTVGAEAPLVPLALSGTG